MQPQIDDLVMLMGMPRSGTTWLGKIFDSHPDTLYRHEPDAGKEPLQDDAERDDIRDYLQSLADNRSTRCSTKAPWFAKRHDTVLSRVVRKPMLHAYRVAARLKPDLQVPDLVSTREAFGPRLVIKSIECSDLIGRVAAALPRSRNIAILRHPCGYVASVLRGTRDGKFSNNTKAFADAPTFERIAASTAARQQRLGVADLWDMAPVERLAWRWVAYSQAMLQSIRRLGNARVLRYEDLCEQPIETARDLMHFVGLSWDAQTEQFLQASTSRERSGFYSLYKDPQKSANRWREELPAIDLDRIEAIARGTTPGALYLTERVWQSANDR